MSAIVQRWRDRRGTYRPAGEIIDPRRYDVALIGDDNTAKAFVKQHHYSATYPAARFRVGLYERMRGASSLVGVAIFSHPSNPLALRPLPVGLESVELGRFVLLDRVPGNGETWFLARAFELIAREGISGVVSFSDPCPRATDEGLVVFGGHIGTIYQAHNAIYLGQARADIMRLLPDGRTLHNRSLAKLRSRDQGWRYVLESLLRYGATPPANTCQFDVDAWLGEWMPQLTRRVRHPGNHKYVWAFDGRARKALSTIGRPYPKQVNVAVAA